MHIVHIVMTWLVTLTLGPTPAAQHDQHAAGHTAGALSAEIVRQLLDGEGMGLAMAAEMNGYPGPKHVLELERELELRPEQKTRVETVRADMLRKAQALGKEIVHAEQALDAAFKSGRITEADLQQQVAAIGALQQELRFTHLRAHLQTKPLLSDAQVGRYRELRVAK